MKTAIMRETEECGDLSIGLQDEGEWLGVRVHSAVSSSQIFWDGFHTSAASSPNLSLFYITKMPSLGQLHISTVWPEMWKIGKLGIYINKPRKTME
jgi:hypothetical protein